MQYIILGKLRLPIINIEYLQVDLDDREVFQRSHGDVEGQHAPFLHRAYRVAIDARPSPHYSGGVLDREVRFIEIRLSEEAES